MFFFCLCILLLHMKNCRHQQQSEMNSGWMMSKQTPLDSTNPTMNWTRYSIPTWLSMTSLITLVSSSSLPVLWQSDYSSSLPFGWKGIWQKSTFASFYVFHPNKLPPKILKQANNNEGWFLYWSVGTKKFTCRTVHFSFYIIWHNENNKKQNQQVTSVSSHQKQL